MGKKNQVSYNQDLWTTCDELVIGLFAELVNREMMWAIGEIVSENNSTKRMRIIKQFIKIARQCKETQNFNSMFAIISDNIPNTVPPLLHRLFTVFPSKSLYV